MTDTDIKSKSSLRNATLMYTFNTLYIRVFMAHTHCISHDTEHLSIVFTFLVWPLF